MEIIVPLKIVREYDQVIPQSMSINSLSNTLVVFLIFLDYEIMIKIH